MQFKSSGRVVMMKSAVILLCAVAWGCSGMEPLTGTVVPEYLNIRSGAGLGYRIIGKLRAGDTVKILSSPDSEWCRIVMPDNASVWIAASMLDEDGIPQKGAVLRSGPGAAYEEIGPAVPGKIEIRGKAKNGKWLRIKPQRGLTAYVGSAYLDIGQAGRDDGKTAEQPVLKPQPEPVVIADSESVVAAEGIVKRIAGDRGDVAYALIVKVNEEEFISAYLTAPGLNLELWEKRQVRVNGRRHWVRGWHRPLITVDKIIPAWQR